jgi:hypothetical protein
MSIVNPLQLVLYLTTSIVSELVIVESDEARIFFQLTSYSHSALLVMVLHPPSDMYLAQPFFLNLYQTG